MDGTNQEGVIATWLVDRTTADTRRQCPLSILMDVIAALKANVVLRT